jgi:signal peptidase I
MKKEIIIPPEFQAKKTGTLFFTIIKFVLAAFLIALPIKWFVAQPFIVSGASMVPTFTDSEYLVIDKVSYRFGEPQRGDVITFQYPLDPAYYFIKRIVGLPGETVLIDGDSVVISGDDGVMHALQEPYISSTSPKKERSTTKLAENEYFVIGDNRSESADSREWGPLQKKFIIGRAFLSVFPLEYIDFFPGKYLWREI